MVRLLHCRVINWAEVIKSFNPTMVRLLLCLRRRQSRRNSEFQSHNGAIAAFNLFQNPPIEERVSIPQWCDCCLQNLSSNYTGDRVSIPQWCDCCGRSLGELTTQLSSFNPTMVRLLPRYSTLHRVPLLFQSHNGAIAAGKFQMALMMTTIVSIPQWCDCCGIEGSEGLCNMVSIPQWCDCC